MKKTEEKSFIDMLNATDMSKREGKSIHTIKTNSRYILVRYQTARSRASYKRGETDTPYTYKYISWNDVKELAEKQFGKKIGFI